MDTFEREAAMRDPTAQFRDAILSAGLEPPEVIEADGKLRRFASNGKRGDDSGWYVLHGDGLPAGAFGDWRTGLSETWCGKAESTLTDAEKRAQRERIEQAKREAEAKRQQTHAEARERAARYWRESKPCDSHPYLQRKGVKFHGVRVYYGPQAINGMPLHGCIAVPARDASGKLHTLEFIHPEPRDGDNKRFLPGGDKSGHYFAIGKPDGVLCIAEGYATGESIHEATGYAVAVAFDAGNLEPVAKALRAKLPKVKIIIAADNDCEAERNTGIDKARAAAEAIGGLVAMPELNGKNCDFNDLATARGPQAVREAIEATKAPAANARANLDGVRLLCASELSPEPLNWLWPGYLARGKLHIAAGAPGGGKTTIALAIAATVTAGGRWPDGARAEAGNVLIWSGEDDPNDTLLPRLLLQGATRERIFFVGDVCENGDRRPFDPAADMRALEIAAAEVGAVSLLIVDPIVNAVAGDGHHNTA